MTKKNDNIVTAEHQPSLTEWFAIVGDKKDSKIIQKEDIGKHERLNFLRRAIGLPYLSPIRVEAIDFFNRTPEISGILKKRGNALCAIRLVPKKTNLPKLRKRGLSLKSCYNSWFLRQKINFSDYYAEICPHSDIVLWSIVIVIDKEGIFGEVVPGQGFQIIHGDSRKKTYYFQSDFSTWRWSDKNIFAARYVKKVIEKLRVQDAKTVSLLKKELKAEIFNGYLGGYFEVAVWPNKKGYFFDFNRILPRYLKFFGSGAIKNKFDKNINGRVAFPGIFKGKVQKLTEKNIHKTSFRKNSILVTDNTDIRFLQAMKEAGAIITERGSILSHASIIARELKVPCIVGVKNATQVLRDGDLVEVDANKGIVKIIKKK